MMSPVYTYGNASSVGFCLFHCEVFAGQEFLSFNKTKKRRNGACRSIGWRANCLFVRPPSSSSSAFFSRFPIPRFIWGSTVEHLLKSFPLCALQGGRMRSVKMLLLDSDHFRGALQFALALNLMNTRMGRLDRTSMAPRRVVISTAV